MPASPKFATKLATAAGIDNSKPTSPAPNPSPRTPNAYNQGLIQASILPEEYCSIGDCALHSTHPENETRLAADMKTTKSWQCHAPCFTFMYCQNRWLLVETATGINYRGNETLGSDCPI
jgi:hypothetical protein